MTTAKARVIPARLPDHPMTERIRDLEDRYGEQVAVAEVADLVADLMVSIEGDISAADLRLHRELTDLVTYIREAREEIARIGPDRIPAEDIPRATDELDAVVKATEEATGIYLDTAEELEKLSAEVSPEHAAKLTELATRIYEASNFQDITGQRIGKVVAALRSIETRVQRLAKLAGHADVSPAATVAIPAAPPAPAAMADADLLNGPALPQSANSQDDIDAILASMD